MIADEFEERIKKLIADAREVGLSDETMIGVLRDVVEALEEGYRDLTREAEVNLLKEDK